MSDWHFGMDYDMWLYPPVDWMSPDYDYELPEPIEAANIEGELLVNAKDAIEQVRKLLAENAKLRQELESVGTAAYLYGRKDIADENAKLRELCKWLLSPYHLGAVTGEGVDKRWCREIYDDGTYRLRELGVEVDG